jgi:ketosteroid isomerase-like protein
MSRTTDELLDGFFAAILTGDTEAISPFYADDVEVWHNVTGHALDRAGSLDLLRYWTDHVDDLRYEILERNVYEGGAVQRHVVHGRSNGTTIAAPVCIVFHVADDRIARIYEYLDQTAVAAVFGSMRAPT